MAVSNYIATDDLTIVLGLVAACLFLLHNLYRPQSLVHPILLGRQSDVARVRHPGESAVYRNYSTGMLGRFPVRPSKEQHVLIDLVKPDLDAPRTLWSMKITNPELRGRIASFGTGLIHLTKLVPQESNALLLLDDGIELLIADLALASYSVPSFMITSLSLLSSVIETHPPSVIITHASFLPHLLELILDSNDSTHIAIVVVGESNGKDVPGHVQLLKWDDVELHGSRLEQLPFATPNPKDVLSVSFYSSPSGELRGAQLTHENLTAGVAATRNLLPLSNAISPLDTIVSAFPMCTPYGRAVAYTAVNEGTSFATFDSTKMFVQKKNEASDLADLLTASALPIPSPTILFVKPSHLAALTSSILEAARSSSSLLYSLAWRHKYAAILDGYITKQSLWDRLVFDSARAYAMGKGAGTVRAVLTGGGPIEAQSLVPSRIALSVPLVNVHIHPLAAGPIFASHPLDLQTFLPNVKAAVGPAANTYAFAYLAPVGPPSVNVEAKLLGVDDAAIEGGTDPIGTLVVRGPSVGKLLSGDDDEDEIEDERWVETGESAKVSSNGTFKVVSLSTK
ncbi:uncharacterized protein FIBRA_06016 [Fibroporia radiculosa]|uniref:AMP-dependent synthetase/ligase domain-containing protein n=1 Tax=Fibroporia radiculosa TaxID=599839 RepID=J4IB14_9APHY|nr:uncharacterized protein FIBRA_06016 [Fibroporia radiculosa]CCM03866.1 predicted protein [Fibroporia radiculosa]